MEKKYIKAQSNRVEVQFESDRETPVPSIDIDTMLLKISSLYYKADLIQTIVLGILNGTNNESIYILQKSLQNSNDVKGKHDITIDDDFDFLYRYGYFVQLFPTLDNRVIKILIDILHDIDLLLRNSGLRRIPLSNGRYFYDIFKQSGFEDCLKVIERTAIDYNQNTYKDHEYLFKCIERKIGYYKTEYKRLITQFDNIDYYRNVISNDSNITNKDDILLRELITPFFTSLKRFDFPLVYMKDESSPLCNGQCFYHFDRHGFRDNYFFEIKSVTHNSPTIISIVAAASVLLPILAKGVQEVLNTEKSFLEVKKLKAEMKTIEKEKKDKEQLKKINNSIAEMNLKINDIDELIKCIPSKYLQKELFQVNASITISLANAIQGCEFHIELINKKE
jgi:hypothetical protein